MTPSETYINFTVFEFSAKSKESIKEKQEGRGCHTKKQQKDKSKLTGMNNIPTEDLFLKQLYRAGNLLPQSSTITSLSLVGGQDQSSQLTTAIL